MGNLSNKKVTIFDKLSLSFKNVEISSYSKFFHSCFKTLSKLEEIRYFLAIKLHNILTKTETLKLQSPTLKDIIKAILWKLSLSTNDLKDSYKISNFQQFLVLNLNNKVILNEDKTLLLSMESSFNQLFDYLEEKKSQLKYLKLK